MLALGIETSCDETSAAVVLDGRIVLSNIVSSQIALHAPFGGVVPEIASRQHVRAMNLVLEAALAEAQVDQGRIEGVCATYGPGLAGALLVGLNFARGLSLGLGVPLIPVNHLAGHIFSAWLTRNDTPPEAPELPLLTLIVSGGHTELVMMSEIGCYEIVGRTVDDAAGEAFDKVARLLGLGYPGGPEIQRVAQQATAPAKLPRAWLPGTFDFSFSGLKTAVLHLAYAAAEGKDPEDLRGKPLPQVDVARGMAAEQVANIAAGFQESVVDVLVTKTLRAAAAVKARSIAIAGGVAANRALRERMSRDADRPLFISPLEFNTDNAAMIAAAGYFAPAPLTNVDVCPSLSLAGD